MVITRSSVLSVSFLVIKRPKGARLMGLSMNATYLLYGFAFPYGRN
jgi:hypothetical protein